jgi:hypothetical protein
LTFYTTYANIKELIIKNKIKTKNMETIKDSLESHQFILPVQGETLGPITEQIPVIDMPLSNVEHLHQEETTFSFDKAVEISGAENKELGVDQGLIGVVSLGPNAAIGLIRIDVNGSKFLAVSRMKKGTKESGERAELIGLLKEGESLALGRRNIEPENTEISSSHFSVSLDNGVKIGDTSLNGSDVVTFETEQEAEDKVPIKGLRRFLRKSKVKEDATDKIDTVDISDFISDINGWSISSAQLHELATPAKRDDENEADWGYTLTPDKMILLGKEIKGYEEPYIDDFGSLVPAKYNGREVIKRDSRLNGGVYIVPGIQEAIVVDDGQGKKSGGNEKWKPVNQKYEDAYRDFKSKLTSKNTTNDEIESSMERNVVSAALESAMDILDYDLVFTESVSDSFADAKINLDAFLEEGKGVCRHQALLAGYYIERMIDGGKLKGSISVDRNQIKGKGGHAWARYTTEDGKVYIIDPAQKFSGTLQEARLTAYWNYDRPDDK